MPQLQVVTYEATRGHAWLPAARIHGSSALTEAHAAYTRDGSQTHRQTGTMATGAAETTLTRLDRVFGFQASYAYILLV
jgi:hypothetical protein